MFIKLTHMANGYKGEVGKPVTGKPNLYPTETKNLYYPNDESGGAGVAPIPDIDRDKIIEVLDSRFKTQLRMYLIELYSITAS